MLRSLDQMPSPSIEVLTLPDGYRLHVRWWRPEAPSGEVLYFHGIQSHGGWYESSGTQLAEKGLAVLMPDRRGSGLNAPPRGHFDSIAQCEADTRHLLAVLLRETGRNAVHIVGVSWGAKQAVLLAQQVPEQVRSLTLVGPGLFPRVDLTTTEKFRVAMAMVNDRERLFDIPLNDARLFTADPTRIEYVAGDPHKLLEVSASFLLTSRRLDKHLRGFARSPFRGPVHVLLAGKDRIIDNDRTRAWFNALPSPDRQLTAYPNAHHTLEFEADPTRFFDDLSNWIAQH